MPAGGSTVIAYEAEPTAFAPLGAEDSVVNTVTVTGAGLPDAVTATETVSPATGPALTISKALSPTEVAANGRLTYTFVIQNTGNAAAEAADSLVVTDTFDPRLSDLTVTRNGPDRADAVHLRCRHRTVRHGGGRHHGARRHVHSEYRRRVQRQSRHQHADHLRHDLSRAGSPRKQ